MARARVSQLVVEALIPSDTYSPTTVTGAGVSQIVVEALIEAVTVPARVSQIVVEALITDSDSQTEPPEPPEPGGDAGVRVFGYAG
jgi:hypothetical protein